MDIYTGRLGALVMHAERLGRRKREGTSGRENGVSKVGKCGAKDGAPRVQDTGQVSSDGGGKNGKGPPSGSSRQNEDLVGGGPRVLREHRVGGL